MLSLDATAVLLLPVVVATAAHLGVHVRPHAWATGHLANSASLLLPVSNLTDLLAFAGTGLSFLPVTGLELGPWLAAVAVEYLVLRRLFRADLAVPAAAPPREPLPTPRPALAVVVHTVAGFAVASGSGLSRPGRPSPGSPSSPPAGWPCRTPATPGRWPPAVAAGPGRRRTLRSAVQRGGAGHRPAHPHGHHGRAVGRGAPVTEGSTRWRTRLAPPGGTGRAA
ncbi:hypothetical protein [Geodermatophilus sp. DSM 44513]|uniref:hypothetical protein n=1 Tax=Geodermatophilus sp. DSM 44513 TaxID=1528104 RepID=UPI001280C2CB|nr:hypothetical protein [Geodermatophilus sp. DSM 44513]WNV77196.1 hypothetical protein RTG05_07955 [Geodermatophilus sp. DSM 44513]